MDNCYICAKPNADKPLALKITFTAHTRCKSSHSNYLCERCYNCIEGKYKQCWYRKDDGKLSKLWGRNWSWLISEDVSFPKFKEGWEGLLEVYDLPTRKIIKEWIINPPKPPFTICIADSGQKHTYPFSQVAYSQSLFPILLEETLIYWNKSIHKPLLYFFENLLDMGFSKKEITSGEYQSNKLIKVNLENFTILENQIQKIRSTEFMDLISFIAQK